MAAFRPALSLALAAALLPPPAGADGTAAFRGAGAAAAQRENPLRGQAGAVTAGAALYAAHCAACHGARGEGAGNVPSLAGGPVQKASDGAAFWFITNGAPGNGMPSWRSLGETERWQLVAFVKALPSGAAAPAVAPQDAAAGAALQAPPPRAPFTDFRYEKPGAARRITAADLPAPYATPAAGNPPHLVARPDGAWPKAPPGFRVGLYAEQLDGPRAMRRAPNGDVFLAESGGGRLRVFRGLGADGRPARSEVFAAHLRRPYGIAFYPPGPDPQWIYVGATDEIVRFAYRNGDLAASGKPQHVADLPSGGGHWTRDLAFSRDGRTLFVGVGSASNVDDPDTSAGERHRANVLALDPDGANLRVYASGIRNPSGLAVDPADGRLWCIVNERDGLGDDLVPDYLTSVREGGFYGWPWWYIGAHQDPRHAGKHPELKDRALVPDVLLQPHSGALQLAFYDGANFPAEYRGDIFATAHGSWNRSVRAGYELMRVARHGGGRTDGTYEDFLTGFVLPDGSAWGRPVGVAVAADGALLVSDDGSGSVWRVDYAGR